MIRYLIILSLAVTAVSVRADENKKVGPDKGVLEADEHMGFKLRPGVEERYGVKTLAFGKGSKTWPRSVILYTKGEVQVFRKRQGYWQAVDVSYTRRGGQVQINSPHLQEGDLIASSGAGLLKIVELDVFSEEEVGHIH